MHGIIKRINNDNSITNSHGTHVAGIMAAVTNNNTGISGVVTNSELYGYATSGDTGNMQMVMKYKYAFANLITKNVKVINVSQNTGRLQCFASSHGNVVSGATVKFRKGWNNKNGDYVKNIPGQEVSVETDDSGDFSIALPIGSYTAEIEYNSDVSSIN